MRAVQMTATGGPDVLVPADLPTRGLAWASCSSTSPLPA
jgi:hypothetical protein